MKSAILFLVFNRPEATRQVFEAIRAAKPPKLYVSADGPRENKPQEAERCQATRDIIKQVDWDCELFTNFKEKNLGCKLAVSSGIDWFFEHEERGIILEDDTLPNFTFFRFCEELLEYYKDDERVMMISGDNFQCGTSRTEYSYYFSRYTHIWGWASWKRAWNKYDVNMRLWPDVRDKGLFSNILSNKKEYSYWKNIFEKVYRGEINTWDYQWLFACWIQSGLTILPNVNLISNIGFDGDSTHTTGKDNANSKIPVLNLSFPLKHPNWMIKDKRADDYTQKTNFYQANIFYRVIRRLYRLVS